MQYGKSLKAFLLSVLMLQGFGAMAESAFPSRSLTMIVPYAGGSGSDVQARLFAEHLSRELQQTVVVENKPGANGAIGMRTAETAPADGHTLVLGGGSLTVINPLMTKNLGYDPDAFIHVAGVSKGYSGFVVGGDSPYKSLEDILEAARQSKQPINIGTYAAFYEMGVAWLGAVSGVEVQNVPYKGGGAILTDLVGGHLAMGFVELSHVLPLAREGKLRILAISSDKASEQYEGIPLVQDTFPDFHLSPWTSILVRKETPPNIVSRLSTALMKGFTTPSADEYFSTAGMSPLDLDEQEMRQLQKDESERFGNLARIAGIEPK